MKNDNQKQKCRRVLAGVATGTLAAVSLTIGSLFGTADELLAVENDEDASQQAAVVSVGKRAEHSAGLRTGEKQTLMDQLRVFFLRQPAAVRAFVLLPLWAAGKVALTAVALLTAGRSPLWQGLLGVLLNALVLFGLFTLVYKLVCPRKRMRDLFKRKNLLPLIAGVLALAATDAALRVFVSDYQPISMLIKVGLGFLVLLLLVRRIPRLGTKSTAGVS
ncbi:MAG: hypothetical protein RRZ24_09775 [Clostridia bacterium]